MRRLRALHLALRAADLIFRSADGGVCAGELGWQLRHFKDGKRLALLDVVADVHVYTLM